MLFVGCAATTQSVLSEKEIAEFKTDAVALIWERLEDCSITEEPELLALYKPAQRRSDTFLQDIRGTELEGYYKQAEKAWEEEWGDVEVECAEPVGIEGRAEIEQDVDEYEKLMTELEGWVELVEERSRS
jgi:hypothetical protein